MMTVLSWIPMQVSGGGQGESFMPFLFMGMIFAIFYVLIFRPENKRRKEHESMLKSVGKGDRVVTAGGIHGSVVGDTEDVLTIEIANVKGERIKIKVDRARVERRREKAKEGDAS